MEPISTGLLIGSIAAPLIGSIIGNFASADDRAAAEEAQRRALEEIERIGAGPDLAKQIFYKQFEVAGVLTPQMERAIELDAPKVAQIKEDPRFKEAQMGALKALQERTVAGFTPEERYEMERQRRAAERSAASQRASVLENLRARGLMDSGAGLAAQLQSADTLAEQQAEAADRASALASQRALQAMGQAGSFAGQLRGQEFDIERTKATAEDEMKRFNVQQQIARQQRDIERAMQAQQYNLQMRQDIMNRNIAQANAEALRRAQAEQQMFQNRLALGQLKAGAYGTTAQQAQQRAGQTQQSYGQIGGAIGQGLGALGSYVDSQPLKDAQMDLYKQQADYYRSLYPAPGAVGGVRGGFVPTRGE